MLDFFELSSIKPIQRFPAGATRKNGYGGCGKRGQGDDSNGSFHIQSLIGNGVRRIQVTV